MNEISIADNMDITLPSYDIKHKDEIEQAIIDYANEVKTDFEANSDDYKYDKHVRATANKQIDEADDKRKAISKAFRKPGNDLKAEVDAMLKPLSDVIDIINEKIKSIEKMEKQSKQQRIFKQIIEPAYQSRGLDPKDATIDQKWLNKGTSDNQILKDVVNYADIASEAAKRDKSWIDHDGNIVNSYGEKSVIKPRRLTVTYYGDANQVETEIMKLNDNVNVISIEFEQ